MTKIRHLGIIVLISVTLLEIVMRVFVAYDLLPGRMHRAVLSKPETFDMEFEGTVLNNAYKKGVAFIDNGTTNYVNDYGGYGPEFDYSRDALRVLTLGSSYTQGCCVAPEDADHIYSRVAEQQLTEALGRNVQFADASAPPGGGYIEWFRIRYGNRIVQQNVQHDAVLLELCLASFNPFIKDWMTEGYQRLNLPILAPIEDLYSFRLIRWLAVAVPKALGARLGLREFVGLPGYSSAKGLVWEARYAELKAQDRPSFDVGRLLDMSPDQVARANQEAVERLGTFPEVLDQVLAVNQLVRRVPERPMVVLIFPEFYESELVTIIHFLKKHDIPFVYLNDMRNGTDRTIWADEGHPSTRKGQKVWADEMVKQLLPLLPARTH